MCTKVRREPQHKRKNTCITCVDANKARAKLKEYAHMHNTFEPMRIVARERASSMKHRTAGSSFAQRRTPIIVRAAKARWGGPSRAVQTTGR